MRSIDIWTDEHDEHDDQDRSRKPRNLTVLAIAGIPWLIVAGLILLPDARLDQDESAAAGPSTGQDEVEPVPSQPDHPDDGALSSPPGNPIIDGAATDEPKVAESATAVAESRRDHRVDDASVGALATIIARAWLTGVTPHLDVPGIEPDDAASYAEHVVVESIERRDSDELVVVTLLAVLLRESPAGLLAETRRVAVPLTIGPAGPALAGPPWWMPSPTFPGGEPTTEAQDDPGALELARVALERAGLSAVEVVTLASGDQRSWRAEVRARTPEGEHLDGPVWLRWDGESFALAGATAGRDGLPESRIAQVGTPDPPPDARSPEVSPDDDGDVR